MDVNSARNGCGCISLFVLIYGLEFEGDMKTRRFNDDDDDDVKLQDRLSYSFCGVKNPFRYDDDGVKFQVMLFGDLYWLSSFESYIF